MKRIHILTILLAGATIFTACRKEAMPAPSDGTARTASDVLDYAYTSAAVFNLSVQKPDPRGLFVWDNGYINITGLVVNTTYKAGGPVPGDQFGATQQEQITLFNQSAYMLGTVKMPDVTCEKVSFTIQSQPSGRFDAIMLNGRYNYAADMPPVPPPVVVLTISDAIKLNTVSQANIAFNGPLYTVSLTLDLAQLTAGITRSMMSDATIENNTIFINKNSNQALYNIILTNIATIGMNAHMSAPAVINPAVTATE